MSRSRFLGLFALPVLVASATAFPLDVSSDFDAAIDLWSRGRKQEALDAMRRMLASDPEPAEVFQVYLAADSDTLADFMAEGDEYTQVAMRFIERASLGRAELRDDEGSIRSLVREYMGATTTADRLSALSRISAQHGEYAVPMFVNVLGDDSDPERVTDAMLAVQTMGPAAVQPLLAALASENDFQRRNVVMALGNIADPRAGAALLMHATADASETIRAAAAAGAERCGAAGDPAALFLQLGDDYHHRRASVLRDLDYSDVVWSWGDGVLVANESPRAIYNNVLAKGAFYHALGLAPDSQDAVAGIARESVDIQSKLAALEGAGADVGSHLEAANEGMLAVMSAGTAALDRALNMSVASGDSATGGRIAAVLGEIASAPTDGLNAALIGGGASMAGEAAVALGFIAARTNTAVSGDVVAELGTAVGRRVVKLAVIIDGDAQRASDLIAALDGQGVLAQHAGSAAQGLVMLGQLGGIDTVLVGDDLPDLTTDAVISRVRQNPAFEGTPTYLLTADEDLADAYGDRIQGSFAGADGIDALSEVFEARLDENRARADALAESAAKALRMLGWRGNSDLSGAVAGLAAATEGRRDGIAVPALHTIGLIGDASHVDVALAVLSNGDASDESRIAAAEAVGMIGGRIDLAATVSSAMREVMDSDASLELRTATAKSLGHMNLGAESRAGVLESVRSRVGAQ